MAKTALLAGVRVLELGGEPAARAGRVLADLGASVTRLCPAGAADPLARRRSAWLAWTAGKTCREATERQAADFAREVDIVLDTPFDPATIVLVSGVAPKAVWVHITPFGMDGPRAHWRAGDLGIMASSGNMYCTGHPDRAPVRAAEATSYAHTGGEAAFAAISALFAGLVDGQAQRVDLSMQECVFIANMANPARFPRTGYRGRRIGANIGKTREIWPARDGFVSFGIRGGKARQASMELIAKLVRDAKIDAPGLDCDWATWSQNTASDAELAAMEGPIGEYFARHTMQELYDIAVSTNLMLAPANSPREVFGSAQLAARGFFAPVGEVARFPHTFLTAHTPDPPLAFPERLTTPGLSNAPGNVKKGGGVWDGVNILEFGSGAAGPIATRYFAEHGATVVRIESRSRPDFLRAMAIAPDNPLGLEGAPMYDGLNCAKRNITLNLKHPDAVALVKRLVVEWADAVAENYAPRAMKGFGLDDASLRDIKPDLVMISACLNGQTGPHKDYPGFGGQGSALSGWNSITGWPDREPVGPHGTITDSLAPRYVAAALAAGLWYRRQTGRGCYLDIAQVETGLYALAPWLLDYELDGVVGMRRGNRSFDAVPHGAFPCADEAGVADRWVAIACHDDAEWATLAAIIDCTDASLSSFAARSQRIDEVESLVARWTASRTRLDVANVLQAHGLEAVPVNDFGDLHDDPQVAHREHFLPLTHPLMGDGLYERNGIRYSDAPSGYWRAGPTLGQDNDWLLGEVLGLSTTEIDALRTSGAVE